MSEYCSLSSSFAERPIVSSTKLFSVVCICGIRLIGINTFVFIFLTQPRSQLDASYPYTREEFQYGYGNRDPNNFPETFQGYQYGYGNRNLNNFPDTEHESFVIVQDNTMMSANYNNAVEEIYLDAESSPNHQHLYDYGRGGALEGPQPTFEREDVDGEDLETVREFNDYHLVPYSE